MAGFDFGELFANAYLEENKIQQRKQELAAQQQQNAIQNLLDMQKFIVQQNNYDSEALHRQALEQQAKDVLKETKRYNDSRMEKNTFDAEQKKKNLALSFTEKFTPNLPTGLEKRLGKKGQSGANLSKFFGLDETVIDPNKTYYLKSDIDDELKKIGSDRQDMREFRLENSQASPKVKAYQNNLTAQFENFKSTYGGVETPATINKRKGIMGKINAGLENYRREVGLDYQIMKDAYNNALENNVLNPDKLQNNIELLKSNEMIDDSQYDYLKNYWSKTKSKL